jgi:hypothetical protein
VADVKDFQRNVQSIGERVQELEAISDPAVRSAARELVQLLMEMHGSAIERMLEIVFQSETAGKRIIDELGQDPLVSSLLILYGLHPVDLETRVERKLAEVRSRLFKMGAEAKLVDVAGSVVRLQVKIEGAACGSTAHNVKTTVEEAIYEAAPDLTSLVLEGLEESPASGFVAMDALLGASAPSSVRCHPIETLASEAMD